VPTRCAYCNRAVDLDLDPYDRDHGPGVCDTADKSEAPPLTQYVTKEHEDLFYLHQGQRSSSKVPLSRKEVEYLIKILSIAIGWQSGPDLNLNPSKLPTRAELHHACEQATLPGSDSRVHDAIRRCVLSLTILESYTAWLPESHRIPVDRDLKYIARQVENLATIYDAISQWEVFRGAAMNDLLAHQLWSQISRLVRTIAESTGTELWSRSGQ